MRHSLKEKKVTVNFELTCPHCGQKLTGEEIIELTQSNCQSLLMTESDHQLVYIGVNLEEVYCLNL